MPATAAGIRRLERVELSIDISCGCQQAINSHPAARAARYVWHVGFFIAVPSEVFA